jgi:hypothetical protein
MLVMPFYAIHKITNNVRLFGHLWCDLWHSFHVFASTASFISLVIIILDR